MYTTEILNIKTHESKIVLKVTNEKSEICPESVGMKTTAGIRWKATKIPAGVSNQPSQGRRN